jgi:hypothetical protein
MTANKFIENVAKLKINLREQIQKRWLWNVQMFLCPLILPNLINLTLQKIKL